MNVRGFGAAALLVACTVWIASGTQHEKPLMGPAATLAIRGLEEMTAMSPRDPEFTRRLAQMYVDERQPGLALALVEGASADVKDDVRVAHVYARALLDSGRNGDALAAERRVLAGCRSSVDGVFGGVGCDGALVACAVRRASILQEMIELGVNDVQAQPEMSLVAYQNATRQAHVSVQ